MQESFLIFITKISLYPTVIFTGLVMFVSLYWLVSLIGMVDMDTVEFGDSGSDTNVSDLSSTGFFTGLMLKLGLYGVPLIIILSLVSLIGWLLSYVYTSFLHQRIDSGILYYLFGTGALVFVLVVSMWLTGIIISPIRKSIAKIPKRNAANNIGKTAIVRTLSVTDKHGEAELNDGGAGLILKIRRDSDSVEQPLKQGDKVLLVEYLNDSGAYRVALAKDK
ncbi:OB-fold-containig protein [Psychrobacter sp. DAB_AL32B]|uniref:OB-fold-containig protein n=1 Tax=Psychrobacter sp. DAB_AL32B TaxID=1028414 RepID=UPI000B7E43DE|nr:OB-fold-containig protein [Psychrobacter sp. DAB_AL32B]OXL23376.1 hypothetical protein CAN34_07225 [Psychrobacter sp. DAB_AL32B]